MRFAHGFKTGEMDDGRYGMFLKYGFDDGTVPEVCLVESRPLPCNGTDPVQNGYFAVGEVVHDDRVVPAAMRATAVWLPI